MSDTNAVIAVIVIIILFVVGLYKSKDGSIINADVNGSYNILRKCNSEFYYDDRIKDISFYPVKFNI